MKRILTAWRCGFFLLVVMMFCVVSISGVEETTVIRVGYGLNAGTIKSPVAISEEGYGYEYLHTIFDQMDGNYQLEFVYCNWPDDAYMLETGEIDLYGPINALYCNEDKHLFTSHGFGRDFVFLSTLSEDAVAYKTHEEIDGSTIAVREGDPHEALLRRFLDHHNMEADIVYFTDSDYESVVRNFGYNYCLCSSMHTFPNLTPVVNLGAEDSYFVTSLDNQWLIDEIDVAMEEIDQTMYMYQQKLYLKYYDYSILADAYISQEGYAKLKEKDLYYIGIEDIYGPIGYRGEDGTFQGVAVDVMNMIAQKADIDYVFVEVTPETTQEELEALDFSFLSYDGNARANTVEGEIFCEMPFIMVERPMYNGETIENIGVMTHYGLTEIAKSGYLYGREVMAYDGLMEMQDAYNRGEVDSMIMTTSNMNLIRRNFDSMDFLVTFLDMSLHLSLIFNQDYDPELMDIFNKIVSQLDASAINSSIMIHSSAPDGDISFVAFIQENPYFMPVVVAIMAVLIIIAIVLTERKRKQQLYQMLNYDKLTGVYSAFRFEQIVAKALAEQDKCFMLATIDVDNFKYINDLFGYDVGNQVLKVVAETIPLLAPNTRAIGRTTSDVFVVLIEEAHQDNREMAFTKGDRSILYRNLIPLIGETYNMSFSIGIYNIRNRHLDIDLMVDCANIARSAGKQYAYTTINEYSKDMDSQRLLATDMMASMVKGIKDREFMVFYQPKIHMGSNETVGAEALVRWSRNGKMVAPSAFIPLFEKNGFVEKLDYYVLEEVCQFLIRHPESPKISVNLSGVTLGKEKVVERIFSIVDGYEIPREKLEFEITETAFIGSFLEVVNKIETLRTCGFTIAMDDFGVGISSLSRLKSMPIDSLKIDRAFIVDCLNNEKGIEIIRNIINMAIGLRLETVAEGIETQRQAAFLMELGCNVGQGYNYSRPLPENEFLSWLHQEPDVGSLL